MALTTNLKSPSTTEVEATPDEVSRTIRGYWITRTQLIFIAACVAVMFVVAVAAVTAQGHLR